MSPESRSAKRAAGHAQVLRGEAGDIPAAAFRAKLGDWYRDHARELPWRGVDDPYATWLSEIMLQQTRVATVIGRYSEFLRRFPTLRALAAAEENDVLALWSGLGYYRRARMLHKGAQFVVRELDGRLPGTEAELRKLPGVGRYTAAAIASIAFGERVAVVDGNVERVLLRLLGIAEDGPESGRAAMAHAAQALVPLRKVRGRNVAGDHNQAMMELGATVCVPRGPLCRQCPVARFCKTRGEHVTRPREKQQSRLVAQLLATRKRGVRTEVLLIHRPKHASLMPGMLELPPLPLDAVAGREPVLRLRHAITNTNYYVELFAEAAPGVGPLTEGHHQVSEAIPEAIPEDLPDDDRLFVPRPAGGASGSYPCPLRQSIPPAAGDQEWVDARRLPHLPLTGLCRKALQRLGVMKLPDLAGPRS